MNKFETEKKDGNNHITENNENKNINESNLIMSNSNIISKTIKEELLYFKNDILKDMKDSMTKLQNKYSKKIVELEDRLNNFQIKSEDSFKKLNVIAEDLTANSVSQEKFSIIEKFRIKANESIMNLNFKIKNLENELHNSVSKYDKIILDSLIFPGIIGAKYEFKNFHELIEFLLNNTRKLLILKEKEANNKKENKKKIDETFDMYKGQVNFCINKVEEFNQFFKKIEDENLYKEIENIRNGLTEYKNNETNMLKRIEDSEKIIENINKELIINTKEKVQNFSKEILNINENMQIIQDKYNESMNDVDIMKKEINNHNNILSKILKDDKFKIFYSIFGDDDSGRIRSKNKLNFTEILKDDLSKMQSNISKDNMKNILSDIEENLTKDKKKFLKLNIKNQHMSKFMNLNFEEQNNNNNNQMHIVSTKSKKEKENHKQELNYMNRILELNKVPKIKQYNNLNILKENEEAYEKKMMESNSFKNIINENDIANINDISNTIHPNEEFFKNYKKPNNIQKINNTFLKKGKEEEKKNEEKYSLHKLEEIKPPSEIINKKANNLLKDKNKVNLKLARNKVLLSAKERERNTYSFIMNEKKEIPILKPKNINNNENYSNIEKNNRLNSSKISREKMKYNRMDINFDDTRLVQKRDNKKFQKSINQIKGTLPYNDRDYFEERVKRFMEFSYKRPLKKNNSVSNFHV